jgi:D-cysteine desulfhydrase
LKKHPARIESALQTAPENGSQLALIERYPKLSSIPRARLCTLPSPVERVRIAGRDIWIKRDDLNAPSCGGNKVRALEFLLGGLGPGDAVITVGGAGSTHVLSTAIHAARIGVRTIASRWRHDMNPAADQVSLRVSSLLESPRISRNPVIVLVSARYRSITGHIRYIPVGGSTPLGALGHVNAALELAAQIRRGDLPMPARIVLPVGSGGTAAGLLVGFAIADMDIDIVGARVGPRVFVNRRTVLALARRTAAFIERNGGERVPTLTPSRLRILHHVYAGAYGRANPRSAAAAKVLHDASGINLDDTYSAKAWVAALDEHDSARGPLLFWLTFDSSCLTT